MKLPCRYECIKYASCIAKTQIKCDVLRQYYYYVKNETEDEKEKVWIEFKSLFPNLLNFRIGKWRYAIVRKEHGNESSRPPYSHPDFAMRYRKMSKVSGM